MKDVETLNWSALTGLRGVAVLMVLLAHASNVGYSLLGFDFSGYGQNGVYLFFSLSSFLLSYQLFVSAGISDMKEQLSIYILKRFSRIYPLLVVSLVGFLSVSILVSPVYVEDLEQFLSILFLNEGPGIFWTIVVEFKYYFILPFVVLAYLYFGDRHKYRMVFILGLVSVLAVLIKSDHDSILKFLGMFILSTHFAYLFASKGGLRLNFKFKLVYFSSALWVFLTIPYLWSCILDMDVDSKFFVEYVFVYSLLCPVVVVGILSSKGIVGRVMNLPVLIRFGELSYSIYLFHMFVVYGFYYMGVKYSFGIWCALFLVIYLVAEFVYRYFERPVTKFLYSKVTKL